MSGEYPWYDSHWLSSYARAILYIRKHYPRRLQDFVRAFDALRTDPRFQTRQIEGALSQDEHDRLKEFIAIESNRYIEKHEVLRFGRTVIHDAELCNELQGKLTQKMSEWVNEPVDPCYNFLSLYNNFGVCRMHLDAPSAKWTFDYCIEQSGPWPIQLSQVCPWPEAWLEYGGHWESAVRDDPANRFTSFELHEGQALVFSGSSQWHYRDRIIHRDRNNFCHLVFFHYVPKGSDHLTNPHRWADHFGIPELARIIVRVREPDTTVIA